MKQKNGLTFLMALGFMLIAISPLYGNKYFNIISGVMLVGVGYYFLRRKK